MNLLTWLNETFDDLVRNIRQRKLQRAAERSRAQRFTKLSCEGLEDRRVLAAPMITDQWVGGFSSDWNTAGNWLTTQNGQRIADAVPQAGYDVVIPALNPGCRAPVVGAVQPTAAVCGSLTDASGTPLTINPSSSLDVRGDGATLLSTWGDANDAPLLTVNGILQIDNVQGYSQPQQVAMLWNNGNITGTGTLYLNNGGTFQALNKAQNLGVNLDIGKDGINGQAQTMASVFMVSDPKAKQDAMGQNLTLLNNVDITVENGSSMKLLADSNQNSQGGIVEGTGSNDAIYDYGSVTGTADTGGQVLTMQPFVSVKNGGRWTEVANERMTFTYGNGPTSIYVGSRSTLELDNNSNILVTGGASSVYLDALGTLLVPSTPGVATSTVTVQGNILDNGTLQIGDANGFAKLNVTGNVDIETGGLTMWAKFDTTGLVAQDQLAVSGQFALDNGNYWYSILTVNTIGNPPKKGIPVTLVTAGSTATKSTQPFYFDKTYFNGYTYPAPAQLTATSYILTTEQSQDVTEKAHGPTCLA